MQYAKAKTASVNWLGVIDRMSSSIGVPIPCRCHPDCPGLSVVPPTVTNRRGRFSQDPEAELRIVKAEEFRALMHFHGMPDGQQPPAGTGGRWPEAAIQGIQVRGSSGQ